MTEAEAKDLLEAHGQGHVLRFWDELNSEQREHLLAQVATIQFPLIDRLRKTWIESKPEEEHFSRIEPVPVIPPPSRDTPSDNEAWDVGEEALRSGKIGLVLVAGGQGTRLGYAGPKGAFPIGPVSGRSLFSFHAEKIHNLQNRYGCELPWYVMVGDSNEEATKAFFAEHEYFGLKPGNVTFFKQRMMPCVSDEGQFFLEEKHRLAMNPNGHGGSIPAMVENGIVADAKKRGIESLSYFQVDNWAVKVADPFFIGHHRLHNSEMSSKINRKVEPRESVGVFCLCDGEYRVIEYTELDIYPQLLDRDEEGGVRFFAGNAAIHMINVDFIERVFNKFDEFPWHCSHKKIPYVDASGVAVQPPAPNGYKFETFVFDALRYAKTQPIAVEIGGLGEYTPIKQLEGSNSVEDARNKMTAYWSEWLVAAGAVPPGGPDATIEISPQYAFSKEEFVERFAEEALPHGQKIAINPDGAIQEG